VLSNIHLSDVMATFMDLMNDELCPFLDSFFIVYLEDILMFSSTWRSMCYI
jgi:hypothetical protein